MTNDCDVPNLSGRRAAVARCPDPAAWVTETVTLVFGPADHQEIQMMKLRDTAGAALVMTLAMSALLLALSGCQKEGPAEQAGKAVDQTVEKAGQQIEKAGDSIQEAAKGDKK